MNVVSAIGGKNKEESRNASFVAFTADDASTQEVGRVVAHLGIPNAFVARGDIDAAITHMSRVEKPPQRLIVDISGMSLPLLALSRLAEACDPSVQVYVLGDQNDVRLYRTLLQTGIHDYLVKPLTTEALRNWLNDKDGNSVRKVRSGKVIAVTGTRGGVGATSIAAHLAAHFTTGKGLRRVAYIDMDIYGSAGSTRLGMASNHALSEVLQNIDRIDPQFLERMLTSKDGRLFALASNQNYSDVLAAQPGVMAQLLDILSQHFHYVVVDLHEPGGVVASEVFSHADMACVVSDHSVHSARILTRLMLHIEANPNAPVLYLLVNSSRAPVRGRVDTKEFAHAISHPIALEIPYDGRLPSLAEDLGEPLAAGSALAKGITKLAQILTGDSAKSAGATFSVARWLGRAA